MFRECYGRLTSETGPQPARSEVMAEVSEWIAAEYFQQLGYLTVQPCRYAVSGRPKRFDEEVDLIVWHPTRAEHRPPENVLWTTADLRHVTRAAIRVAGGFSSRFRRTPPSRWRIPRASRARSR